MGKKGGTGKVGKSHSHRTQLRSFCHLLTESCFGCDIVCCWRILLEISVESSGLATGTSSDLGPAVWFFWVASVLGIGNEHTVVCV